MAELASPKEEIPMHDYLIEMLECPACHGELNWQIGERPTGIMRLCAWIPQ